MGLGIKIFVSFVSRIIWKPQINYVAKTRVTEC